MSQSPAPPARSKTCSATQTTGSSPPAATNRPGKSPLRRRGSGRTPTAPVGRRRHRGAHQEPQAARPLGCTERRRQGEGHPPCRWRPRGRLQDRWCRDGAEGLLREEGLSFACGAGARHLPAQRARGRGPTGGLGCGTVYPHGREGKRFRALGWPGVGRGKVGAARRRNGPRLVAEKYGSRRIYLITRDGISSCIGKLGRWGGVKPAHRYDPQHTTHDIVPFPPSGLRDPHSVPGEWGTEAPRPHHFFRSRCRNPFPMSFRKLLLFLVLVAVLPLAHLQASWSLPSNPVAPYSGSYSFSWNGYVYGYMAMIQFKAPGGSTWQTYGACNGPGMATMAGTVSLDTVGVWSVRVVESPSNNTLT